MFEIIVFLVFLTVLGVFIGLWITTNEKLKAYTNRFKDVIDIDKELKSVEKKMEKLRAETEKQTEKLKDDAHQAVKASFAEQAEIQTQNEQLKEKYRSNKAILQQLIEQIAIYNEEVEYAELGFYRPHFDFESSERFKQVIADCREEQKALLKSKQAIFSTTEWTVEGSRAKGKTMMDRAIRLTARAFNNECDAAISNVTWKNVMRMEQRIERAYEALHKLNESNRIQISREYLNLKLKELRLTHEYRNKKQQEKEEQAEIRRQMREEAKLEQELEKSIREEERYQKMLKRAQQEAAKATGARLEALNAKITELTGDLEEAQAMSQRAKSMAEQTKRGHVYVISNIGSFGDDVYKIGMTRRLEPLDRVKELGDASVPFTFDVHAMIYSEDAPGLEAELHRNFDEKRLNLVNTRREFFRTTLDQIEKVALKISPEIEFIRTPEAREYYESIAIRRERREQNEEKKAAIAGLPDELD